MWLKVEKDADYVQWSGGEFTPQTPGWNLRGYLRSDRELNLVQFIRRHANSSKRVDQAHLDLQGIVRGDPAAFSSLTAERAATVECHLEVDLPVGPSGRVLASCDVLALGGKQLSIWEVSSGHKSRREQQRTLHNAARFFYYNFGKKSHLYYVTLGDDGPHWRPVDPPLLKRCYKAVLR